MPSRLRGRDSARVSLGAVRQVLAGLLVACEHVAGFLLAVDVLVVFASVIWRYFLHDPLLWAEEIARALMVTQTFLGAAAALGRAQHLGIDSFRGLFPAVWRPAVVQLCHWVIVAVSVALFLSSCVLLADSQSQTTPFGLPQSIYVLPLVAGSLLMILYGTAAALAGPRESVWATLAGGLMLALAVWGWNALVPVHPITPIVLLGVAFVFSVVIGVPIAFALAFSALLYFLAEPSLPMLVYSQQILAGMDHFVLLAIPFFVLAGLRDGGQRHVVAPDRAASAADGARARRSQPDHDHRHRIFLRSVRLQAG